MEQGEQVSPPVIFSNARKQIYLPSVFGPLSDGNSAHGAGMRRCNREVVLMTPEERREYRRRWRRENRDKIKEQDRESARRRTLAELESVKQLDGGVVVMRCNDGREYIIGGRRR